MLSSRDHNSVCLLLAILTLASSISSMIIYPLTAWYCAPASLFAAAGIIHYIYTPTIKVKPVFAWFDLWVGIYIDRPKKRVFVMPLPCIGFVISFGVRPNSTTVILTDPPKIRPASEVDIELIHGDLPPATDHDLARNKIDLRPRDTIGDEFFADSDAIAAPIGGDSNRNRP